MLIGYLVTHAFYLRSSVIAMMAFLNTDIIDVLPLSSRQKKWYELSRNTATHVIAFVALFFAAFILIAIPIPAAHALGGNNLYVSSSSTDEVKRYNASTGTFIDNFVPAGGGGLYSPSDLTFGPDGNLYLLGVGEVKRYNGTTGILIHTFVSGTSGPLGHPTVMIFGPDGNLYVGSIGVPIFGSPGAISRFDGYTGAFIDNLAPEFSGELAHPTALTFGPDGNLYAVSQGFEIKRYNGTTGAFIDTFVPDDAGGLSEVRAISFSPDGNLYVISTNTGDIKRYNGTTGAFIDNFVPAGSGGLSSPAGLVFAAPPPPPVLQKHTLTVNSEDLSGNLIKGVWTTIRTSDGVLVNAGYTPFTFTGDSGAKYKVTLANYDGRVFSSWKDDVANTSNSRIISLVSDTELIATFDLGDSLRGFTSITYAGTTEQADLTVNAHSLDGNRTLNMWFIIDPQSTDANGMTYRVYASNYKDRVFDHWEDSSTDRIRTLTATEAKTITAYYQTG